MFKVGMGQNKINIKLQKKPAFGISQKEMTSAMRSLGTIDAWHTNMGNPNGYANHVYRVGQRLTSKKIGNGSFLSALQDLKRMKIAGTQRIGEELSQGRTGTDGEGSVIVKAAGKLILEHLLPQVHLDSQKKGAEARGAKAFIKKLRAGEIQV